MQLVKCRDVGMSTYTYFWVDDSNRVVSPYFECDVGANIWYGKQLREWKENGKNDLRREMASRTIDEASQEKSQETVDEAGSQSK